MQSLGRNEAGVKRFQEPMKAFAYRRVSGSGEAAGDGYSDWSLAFAASFVCHCMLLGASAPPRFSGVIWSITYPGQAPEVRPVDGHGFERSKVCLAVRLR